MELSDILIVTVHIVFPLAKNTIASNTHDADESEHGSNHLLRQATRKISN